MKNGLFILVILLMNACTYHQQNQDTKAQDVQLFPNPASNTTHLSYNICKNGQLYFKKLNGDTALQVVIPKGNKTHSIDISGLPNGIYMYYLGFSATDFAYGKLYVAH
jgi:hypothetical protein